MPLTARTPRSLFQTVQDHCNRTLNTVLTRYRLRFPVRTTRDTQTSLTFLDTQGVTSAVPLLPSPWYLAVILRLRAIPERNEYGLRILEYQFRIQRTASVHDEAEVRFEYVSPEIDPDFPYSRHHVQFHRAYQHIQDGFSPNKLHIPTGGVTIEQVIRFLIADLGVPPLTDRWEEELRESERVSREWLRND